MHYCNFFCIATTILGLLQLFSCCCGLLVLLQLFSHVIVSCVVALCVATSCVTLLTHCFSYMLLPYALLFSCVALLTHYSSHMQLQILTSPSSSSHIDVFILVYFISMVLPVLSLPCASYKSKVGAHTRKGKLFFHFLGFWIIFHSFGVVSY